MKIYPLFFALLLSPVVKANVLSVSQLDTLPMIHIPSFWVFKEWNASVQSIESFDSPFGTRHTDFLETQHSPQSFESSHFTFKSYPNPVADRILIEVGMTTDVLKKSMIELSDATGNIVRNVPCLPRMSLPVDDLPQGKYTICIKTNGQLQTTEPVEIKR